MMRFAISAGLVAIGLALTPLAFAQAGDNVLAQARANGLIGEQADGYLGYVPGATISADLRGRVEQNNIRRRQLYTQRAAQAQPPATAAEMAAAVACEVFEAPSIRMGERYRNEAGQWRQRTASQPIEVPARCNPPSGN